MCAGFELVESRTVGLPPLREQFRDHRVECGELGVSKNHCHQLSCRHFQAAVPGTAGRFEERRTNAGEHLPITIECVNVPIWDTATQVPVDVLRVFHLSALDVS